MKKRILSTVCCLVLMLSLFPVSVFAQESSIVTTFTESFGGKAYTVQEGYYCYEEGFLPYFYSDGFFEEASTAYSPHLSTMSLNMAIASTHSSSLPLKYRHSPTRQLLCEIGCDEDSIFVSNSSLKRGERDSIAFSLGNKELTYANSSETGCTLVPIVVRGAGYQNEWYSNAILGDSGEAEGFLSAATKILDEIDTYLEANDLAGKPIKFWVTGYSRGGAVANLVAKHLVDAYSTDAVYAYTFEAPMGGMASAKITGKNYNCIHNVVNYADLVPYVAPSEMGFIRYGQDHVFPFSDNTCMAYASTEAAYNSRKDLMRAQYALLVEEADNLGESFDAFDIYSFDQELTGLKFWELMELLPKIIAIANAGSENIQATLLEQEIISKHAYSASRDGNYNKLTGDYMKTLLGQMQSWTMTSRDPQNPSINYREQYATYESYLAGGTNCNESLDTSSYIQTVMAHMLEIFFTKSSEQLKALGDRAETVLDEYKIDVSVEALSAAWDKYGPIFSMVLYWNELEHGETTVATVLGKSLKTPTINDAVRLQYISEFYTKFFNAIALQPGDSYLTQEEIDELKEEWATLFNFALSFLSADYNHKASTYNFSAGGDGRTVMLATLLMNTDALSFNHECTTSLAWLRSYDSYYSGSYAVSAKASITASCAAPTVYIGGIAASTDSTRPTALPCNKTVTLNVPSVTGETICYTLTDLTHSTTLASEQLDSGVVTIPPLSGSSTLYRLTVQAWSYNNTSASVNYYIENKPNIVFDTVQLGSQEISYQLKSNYDVSPKLLVIAASYHDGQLVESKVSSALDLSGRSGSGTVSLSVNPNDSYRLFLISQGSSYAPLSDCWVGTN